MIPFLAPHRVACCRTGKFSAGGFVTSAVLAELSFTQLSLTAGSFDPGRAPPLHSCLCPVFIQEAPGVQTLSGTSESDLTPTRPQPHPDRSCQDG